MQSTKVDGPERAGEVEWKMHLELGGVHPRAQMQKFEKKEIAGGPSWKRLKTKVQICRDRLQGSNPCTGGS